MKGARYEQGYTDGYLAGVKSLREQVDSSTSIEAFIAWYDREFPGEHRCNSHPVEPLPVIEEGPVKNVDGCTELVCSRRHRWVEEPKLSLWQRIKHWFNNVFTGSDIE